MRLLPDCGIFSTPVMGDWLKEENSSFTDSMIACIDRLWGVKIMPFRHILVPYSVARGLASDAFILFLGARPPLTGRFYLFVTEAIRKVQFEQAALIAPGGADVLTGEIAVGIPVHG